MMSLKRIFFLALLFGLVVFIAGCDATTPAADAGADAASDSGIIDAGLDSGFKDAGPDAGDASIPDSSIDAGPDSGPDAAVDGGDADLPDGGREDGGVLFGEWTQIKPDDSELAPVPLAGHTAVVKDGKAYIIGGGSFAGAVFYWKDVWEAVDGTTWTRIRGQETPGFSARSGHTSVVFDSKIWVIGGEGAEPPEKEITRKNDVWSSEDGVNWSKVKDNNQDGFEPRLDHSSVVFDGKMWVIGGWAIIGDTFVGNDVWNSVDGYSWGKVKENDQSGFPARRSHCSVAFKGKMWVIGGNRYTSTVLNDVWSSSDGLNWNKVKEDNTEGFSKRSGHSCLVYKDKIWLIGGLDGPYHVLMDAWSSSDGLNWVKEKEDDLMGFPPGRHQAAAWVKDDVLWIHGGRDLYSTSRWDAWHSVEGKNWENIDYRTLFKSAKDPAGVAHGSELFIVSGVVDYETHNEIFKSADGKTWEKVETVWKEKFSPRSNPCLLSYKNKIWFLGGQRTNDVWTSEDGSTWELVKPDGEGGYSKHYRLNCVVHDHKIWLVGGAGSCSGCGVNDVWSSTNGADWNEVRPDGAGGFPRRKHSCVVAYDGKLWVIGGEDGNGKANDVWASTDGVDWVQVKPNDNHGFPPRSGHKCVVQFGKMVVLGYVQTDGYPVNDMWVSTDGKNWSEVIPSTGVRPFFRENFVALPFMDRVWMLGGEYVFPFNDVWAFDLQEQ